jgi:hypothetical protein
VRRRAGHARSGGARRRCFRPGGRATREASERWLAVAHRVARSPGRGRRRRRPRAGARAARPPTPCGRASPPAHRRAPAARTCGSGPCPGARGRRPRRPPIPRVPAASTPSAASGRRVRRRACRAALRADDRHRDARRARSPRQRRRRGDEGARQERERHDGERARPRRRRASPPAFDPECLMHLGNAPRSFTASSASTRGDEELRVVSQVSGEGSSFAGLGPR